jgi:PAS domain-containing protein
MGPHPSRLGSSGDLSEREEAEARRPAMREVISSSGDAVWSGSPDGTTESWDPRAGEQTQARINRQLASATHDQTFRK